MPDSKILKALRGYRVELEIDGLTFIGFPDHPQVRINSGPNDWDDSYFIDGEDIRKLRDFLNKVLDKMPGSDTIDT